VNGFERKPKEEVAGSAANLYKVKATDCSAAPTISGLVGV
jgi:hypothetical protein